MLVFRQLFDARSSSYSYLLADMSNGEAVLIDPVLENVQRDAALVEELGLRLSATLETHIHADHVTGAWFLRRDTGSRIFAARDGGAEGADRYLEHGDVIAFGTRHLSVRATPGHTSGCLTFVLDDLLMAFTGDCLLIRGSGRTDFQQGDATAMFSSVRQQLFSLPDTCLLYPAHDYHGLTVTTILEERRFNPRLGSAITEAEFIDRMKNLRLDQPRLIDVAVPANLRCGQPGSASDVQAHGAGARQSQAHRRRSKT